VSAVSLCLQRASTPSEVRFSTSDERCSVARRLADKRCWSRRCALGVLANPTAELRQPPSCGPFRLRQPRATTTNTSPSTRPTPCPRRPPRRGDAAHRYNAKRCCAGSLVGDIRCRSRRPARLPQVQRQGVAPTARRIRRLRRRSQLIGRPAVRRGGLLVGQAIGRRVRAGLGSGSDHSLAMPTSLQRPVSI
jgi:hypothetical protein